MNWNDYLLALRDMIQLAYDATQYDADDDEVKADDLARIKKAINAADAFEAAIKEESEMKTRQVTKDAALKAVECITEDIQMLASGEWIPDDDSCEATRLNIELIRSYVLQTEELQ